MQSEHKFQVSVADYLNVAMRPELFWFAVPNGGLRNLRVASQLKAEGLKPGVSDIGFLLHEGKAAWMELKTEIGRLSPYQEGFKHRCEMLGHPWFLVRTLDEVVDVAKQLGVLRSSLPSPAKVSARL